MADFLLKSGDPQTQIDGKIDKTLLTTKGDMIVRDASGPARLPVGADGQTVLADAVQTLGVRYGDIEADPIQGIWTPWFGDLSSVISPYCSLLKAACYKPSKTLGLSWDKTNSTSYSASLAGDNNGPVLPLPAISGTNGALDLTDGLDLNGRELLDLTGVGIEGTYWAATGLGFKAFCLPFAGDAATDRFANIPGARSQTNLPTYQIWSHNVVLPVACTLVAVHFRFYDIANSNFYAYKNGVSAGSVAISVGSGNSYWWYPGISYAAGDRVAIYQDSFSGGWIAEMFFTHAQTLPIWPVAFGGYVPGFGHMTCGNQMDAYTWVGAYGVDYRFKTPIPGTVKYASWVRDGSAAITVNHYKNGASTGASHTEATATGYTASVGTLALARGDFLSLYVTYAATPPYTSQTAVIWIETDPADL